MHCERFEEILTEQTDAPLPAEALAHLGDCSPCQLLRDDLSLIQVAAREWGTQEAIPSPRVWAAIKEQLYAEGLIRESHSESSLDWAAAFWNFVPRLEMAGAYVLLLLVAGGIAGYRLIPVTSSELPQPAVAAQISVPSFEGLGRTLDGNMQQVVASFPESATVALSLRDNLTIVDNLIAVCEKTVREHPGDPLALEYLYGAYQQKADLLAVAMDRSSEIQ